VTATSFSAPTQKILSGVTQPGFLNEESMIPVISTAKSLKVTDVREPSKPIVATASGRKNDRLHVESPVSEQRKKGKEVRRKADESLAVRNDTVSHSPQVRSTTSEAETKCADLEKSISNMPLPLSPRRDSEHDMTSDSSSDKGDGGGVTDHSDDRSSGGMGETPPMLPTLAPALEKRIVVLEQRAISVSTSLRGGKKSTLSLRENHRRVEVTRVASPPTNGIMSISRELKLDDTLLSSRRVQMSSPPVQKGRQKLAPQCTQLADDSDTSGEFQVDGLELLSPEDISSCATTSVEHVDISGGFAGGRVVTRLLQAAFVAASCVAVYVVSV